MRLKAQIDEIISKLWFLERELQEIVDILNAMPRGRQRSALVQRAIKELGLDPALFGIRQRPERRSTWTEVEWAAEAVEMKRAARQWKNAGRLDKSQACEADARRAELTVTRLKAAQRNVRKAEGG